MEQHEPYEPFKEVFCELIESGALSGNLKEAKTGKYILCDLIQATNYGFSSPKDLVGLTASDSIEHFITKTAAERPAIFPGLERVALNKVLRCENEILITGEPNFSKYIIPACSGIIHIARIIKLPVFGQNKKVLAICTTDTDITDSYNLSDLLALYTQYFNRIQAISNFLRYLGLIEFFEKLPSLQELKLLIKMIPNAASKQVALTEEGLKLRTVEGVKARIQSKLKILSLRDLLAKLRTRLTFERI